MKLIANIFNLFPKRLNLFLTKVLTNMNSRIQSALCSKALLSEIKVGDTTFKLWFQGGLPEAQKMAIDHKKHGTIYELVMMECLKKVLDFAKKSVFIDIGAFMGYYCCFVAGYLKDSENVYGIESNPEYCRTIRRSIEENGYKHVKLLEAVLSDKEETLNVVEQAVIRSNNNKGLKSRTITLDSLCATEKINPTLLKIDVHGAEGKIIAGAKEILKKSVDFILLELHPDDYLKKYSPGITREDIFSILEEAGFNNYYINGHRFLDRAAKRLFVKSGKIKYFPILPGNKDALFIDRFSDMFIFAIKKRFKISQLKCFEE